MGEPADSTNGKINTSSTRYNRIIWKYKHLKIWLQSKEGIEAIAK